MVAVTGCRDPEQGGTNRRYTSIRLPWNGTSQGHRITSVTGVVGDCCDMHVDRRRTRNILVEVRRMSPHTCSSSCAWLH